MNEHEDSFLPVQTNDRVNEERPCDISFEVVKLTFCCVRTGHRIFFSLTMISML